MSEPFDLLRAVVANLEALADPSRRRETRDASTDARDVRERRTPSPSFLRPSLDAYYLAMAKLAALRSTCRRRAVGCVLVDERGRVLSIGYNGAPSGFPHCLDVPCPGANAAPGTQLNLCDAIHAEQSALVSCRDLTAIRTAYLTTSPCVSCTKLFLNTLCTRIIFVDAYPDSIVSWALWKKAGNEWIAYDGIIDVRITY